MAKFNSAKRDPVTHDRQNLFVDRHAKGSIRLASLCAMTAIVDAILGFSSGYLALPLIAEAAQVIVYFLSLFVADGLWRIIGSHPNSSRPDRWYVICFIIRTLIVVNLIMQAFYNWIIWSSWSLAIITISSMLYAATIISGLRYFALVSAQFEMGRLALQFNICLVLVAIVVMFDLIAIAAFTNANPSELRRIAFFVKGYDALFILLYAALLVSSCILLVRFGRQISVASLGRCRACGYILLVENKKCPECGTTMKTT